MGNAISVSRHPHRTQSTAHPHDYRHPAHDNHDPTPPPSSTTSTSTPTTHHPPHTLIPNQSLQPPTNPSVDPHLFYTLPSGLYPIDFWNPTFIQHKIKNHQLAPRYPPQDHHSLYNSQSCPICLQYYPSINQTKCCTQNICTECFLQISPPRHRSHQRHHHHQIHNNSYDNGQDGRSGECPFCKEKKIKVVYKGMKDLGIVEKEWKEKEEIKRKLLERKTNGRTSNAAEDEKEVEKRRRRKRKRDDRNQIIHANANGNGEVMERGAKRGDRKERETAGRGSRMEKGNEGRRGTSRTRSRGHGGRGASGTGERGGRDRRGARLMTDLGYGRRERSLNHREGFASGERYRYRVNESRRVESYGDFGTVPWVRNLQVASNNDYQDDDDRIGRSAPLLRVNGRSAQPRVDGDESRNGRVRSYVLKRPGNASGEEQRRSRRTYAENGGRGDGSGMASRGSTRSSVSSDARAIEEQMIRIALRDSLLVR